MYFEHMFMVICSNDRFVRIGILLELRMDSMTSFDLDLLHRFLTYYLVRIDHHRWRVI